MKYDRSANSVCFPILFDFRFELKLLCGTYTILNRFYFFKKRSIKAICDEYARRYVI